MIKKITIFVFLITFPSTSLYSIFDCCPNPWKILCGFTKKNNLSASVLEKDEELLNKKIVKEATSQDSLNEWDNCS